MQIAQGIELGNVKKITIPGTVKKIEKGTFYNTNLDVMIIEEGVEKIEKYAVNTKVSEVILETGIERLEWDIFITAPEEIYVPPSVKEIDYDPMGTGLDLIVHCKEKSYADGIFDEFFQEVTYIYDYE